MLAGLVAAALPLMGCEKEEISCNDIAKVRDQVKLQELRKKCGIGGSYEYHKNTPESEKLWRP